MRKLKVGDRCRIRQFDDMAAEFGEEGGGILCTPYFTPEMKYLCGQTFTIKSKTNFRGWCSYSSVEGIEGYWGIGSDMLELDAPPINEVEFDVGDINELLIG